MSQIYEEKLMNISAINNICLIITETASIEPHTVNKYISVLKYIYSEASWDNVSLTIASASHSEIRLLEPHAGSDGPIISSSDPFDLVGTSAMQAAYRVYEWLRRTNFDVVFAPVQSGLLFYALEARRQELDFLQKKFIGILDNTSMMELHLSKKMPDDFEYLVSDHMERVLSRLADIIIITNDPTKEWVARNEWPAPVQVICLPAMSNQADRLLPEPLAAQLCAADSAVAVRSQGIARRSGTNNTPLVSVCIPHFNRPSLLKQTIDSIAAQSYKNYEIIVVDDGSNMQDISLFLDNIERDNRHHITVLKHDVNRYLGAARNTAARAAQGEFLFFIDDDDYSKPTQIETLVKVAKATQSDVVNSLCDRFIGDTPPKDDHVAIERWLMLGNCPSVGLFRKSFGPSCCLIRRDSFLNMGGFTEIFGVGCEDWELFARMSIAGMSIELVPRALFWYRSTPNSMTHNINSYESICRIINPYIETMPKHFQALVLFSKGLYDRAESLDRDIHLYKKNINEIMDQHDDLNKFREITTPGERPQDAVNALWQSRSWRFTYPLRWASRLLHGKTNVRENPPSVTTWQEAGQIIASLRRSTSWEITALLRVLSRTRKEP